MGLRLLLAELVFWGLLIGILAGVVAGSWGAAMKMLAEVMKAPVVTVEGQHTAIDVQRIARRHEIRHFPVVEGDKLIGIVTDRTVREATTSPRIFSLLLDLLATVDRIQVAEIMETSVITAPPDMSLPDAVKLMREHRIGCLPVVQEGRLVGIVTTSDLLVVLAEEAKQGK